MKISNEKLVHLYQNGDKQALESIIEQNKGIVNKIVNRFYTEKTNSIDREDLMQEGFIGLIVAANKYDINNEKKALFITYAVYWIRQKIIRFIHYKNTNDETSLNAPTNKEGNNELADYIEGVDYSFENIEDKIYVQQIHEELDQAMFNFNTLKEQKIIKMHYGWDKTKSMTLREIGTIFGVTWSRINSIEHTAFLKIRHSTWGRNKNKNKISSTERISFAERYFM